MLRNYAVDTLRAGIVRALKADAEISDDLAARAAALILRYLSDLQRKHGRALYIPVPPKQYPLAEIRKARDDGETVRSICRQFGISSSTFYRLTAIDRD